MLRWIASLGLLATLAAGCAAPLTKMDLEMGAVQGIVVDRIPAINAEDNSAAWYIEVENYDRSVSRIAVTYDAFQAVDMGDVLPDDIIMPLPGGSWREREQTPWP